MGEIQAFIRSFHHKLSLRVIIVKENKFPFIGIFQLGKKEEKKKWKNKNITIAAPNNWLDLNLEHSNLRKFQ